MHVELNFIPGMMLGLEFVNLEEGNFLIIDLLIVRILFVLGEK